MYITYKTTNIITKEFYIGSHKTDNPNDDYLGSGRLIRKSIEKYGVKNHKKEVMGVFDTRKESLQLEKLLIKEKSKSCGILNNNYGGGSFDFINENNLNNSGQNYKKANAAWINLIRDDVSFKEEFSEKVKDAVSDTERAARSKRMLGNTIFLDRKHSIETKNKISKSAKVRTQGKGNSQYGTFWITNGHTNQKWSHLKGPLPTGYYRGRVV